MRRPRKRVEDISAASDMRGQREDGAWMVRASAKLKPHGVGGASAGADADAVLHAVERRKAYPRTRSMAPVRSFHYTRICS